MFRTVFQGKDLHVQNKICLIVPKIEETIKKIQSSDRLWKSAHGICSLYDMSALVQIALNALTYTLYNVLIADFFLQVQCVKVEL